MRSVWYPRRGCFSEDKLVGINTGIFKKKYPASNSLNHFVFCQKLGGSISVPSQSTPTDSHIVVGSIGGIMSLLQYINDGIRGDDGLDGSSGHSGSSGGGHGGHGSNGTPGQRGTSSGTIDVTLSARGGEILVAAHLGPREGSSMKQGTDVLTLGDPRNEVRMSARGGDGGDGGHGGRGGDGKVDPVIMDVTQLEAQVLVDKQGSDGGPGGDGGDGGHGARGGDSGNGSNINVHNRQCDMDLLMLLRQKVSNTEAGVQGSGGNGGSGGSGGSGGYGGSSYSWEETTYYTDGDGNRQSQSTSYSNPGGSNGWPGQPGRGGDGTVSTFGVNVATLDIEEEMESLESIYASPYDLEVSSIKYEDTIGYGIIEPASDVNLTVTHTNVGGMPTPSHQIIHSYVRDNKWVVCPVSNRVPMKKWIESGERTTLNRPILYNVNDFRQQAPFPREPYVTTGSMDHEALVERVNQNFSRVANKSHAFTIEYPAQSSLIKGLDCITLGDESPILFSIWNKSKLGLGNDIKKILANSPTRVLFARLRVHLKAQGGTDLLQPTDFLLRDIRGNVFGKPHEGVHANIPALAPGTLDFFATTFQFTSADLKPYTRVLVESSLYLGHVKNMMDAQQIQSRPFEIQLSEGYQSGQASDFLLVTNNQTEFAEVSAWRMIAADLGRTLNVWNVNLYKDLCLAHPKKDGTSLLTDFRCKTIIFLNNTYLRDERLYDAAGFIRARELFNAAKFHGINTLVIGSHFDMANELIPAVHGHAVAYFKSTEHYMRSLKRRILPGAGSAFPMPASTVPTVSTMLMLSKKLRFVALHATIRTLCIYSHYTDVYPVETVHLDAFNVTNITADTSFDLVLPHLGKTLTFSAPVEKKAVEKAANLVGELGPRLNYALGSSVLAEAMRGISAITMSPDTSSSNKEGVLEVRKRDSASSGFKKCFFVLNVNERTLTRFDEKKSPKSKRVYALSRYSLALGNELGNEAAKDRATTFQILTPTSKALFLRAKTSDDRDSWITALAPLPAIEFSQVYKEPSFKLKQQMSLSDLGSAVTEQVTVTENNTVNIIPVNERYFISKPKDKDLEKKAKKLQKKLRNRFPNQRNVVVYQPAIAKLDKMALHHLGSLEVHRALDTTTPHIVQIKIESDAAIHAAESVRNYATVYNLVKVVDFRGKLRMLDELLCRGGLTIQSTHFTGTGPANMIIIAIMSDIAEEQFHFRESKWKDKFGADRIYSLIHTLTQLKTFNFACVQSGAERGPNTLLGDVILEIGAHLSIMRDGFTTLADKLLPLRRGRHVNAAVKRLWWEIVQVHVHGVALEKAEATSSKPDAAAFKAIKECLAVKKTAWQEFAVQQQPVGIVGYTLDEKKKLVKAKSAIIEWYRRPHFSNSVVDSMVDIDRVMTRTTFQSKYEPLRPSTVEENRATFTSDQQRTDYVANMLTTQLGCSDSDIKRLLTIKDI
eukprot:gene15290-18103_t